MRTKAVHKPSLGGGRGGPRPRGGRWLRRIALVVLAVFTLSVASVALLWVATPSVSDLQARIDSRLAAHGSVDLGAQPGPDRVGQAVVATEDSGFFHHVGIDPRGALRGMLGLVTGSEDAGGATLDQQLAKVIYTPEQHDLRAKLEQVVLGVKIDRAYTKPQILHAYLASVYFGHGYYGLPAAARGYFGCAPAQLSWGQASLLAGLVQAPSALDPTAHLDLAKARQRHVLDRLVTTGILTPADADTAAAHPLHLLD